MAARTGSPAGGWRTANRVLSWVPNLLADALVRGIAVYLLGSREVQAREVAAAVRNVGEHYGASFRGVRIVQLSWRAAGVLRRRYHDVLAATWCSTVYLMPGALVWNEDGGITDPEGLDTLAHELWHVHQFRSTGGGLPWVLRWLVEHRRYGLWDMPIEAEAREMAAKFVRWREFLSGCGYVKGL